MINDLICNWLYSLLLDEEFDHSLLPQNTPIKLAIIELINCKSDYENSQARISAQKILQEEDQYEFELFILFLNFWAVTAIKLAHLIEAKAILSRINKYTVSNQDLNAFICNTNGFYSNAMGNKTIRETLLLKSLAMISPSSKTYEPQLLVFLRFLATMGRFNTTQKMKKFKDNRSLVVEKLILIDQFFQTNQGEKFEDLLKTIDIEEFKPYKQMNVAILRKAFQKLSNGLTSELVTFDLNDSNISFSDNLHVALYYLKNKKNEEALAWAKRFSLKFKVGMKRNNLAEYTLIRAELSNKNYEVAYKLLQIKIKEGSQHYLDNFFLARIELLKGNQNEALKLFKLAYEYCLYFDAINRLFFELDHSIELSKKDIVFWLRECLLCKPKSFAVFQTLESETNEVVKSIIGKSKPIELLKKTIKKYANSNATILINGETGVGKDEVAQNLHLISKRKDKPFLVINCGAISETLLYSELFGHTKGSYTGAIKDQKGIFEAAGEGVVFLDEIGDISEQVQVSLLRILESNEIKPLGSAKPIPIYCRVIAATNKDLKLKVKQGTFREDLYFRLNRLEIQVPSLRERGADIIELADYFLNFNRTDKKLSKLSETLKATMLNYSWPGNIRQLKNEIEKARIYYSDKLVYEIEDFDFLNSTPKKNVVEPSIQNRVADTLIIPIEKNQYDSSLKSSINQVINNEKTLLRRREKIKSMFLEVKNLTRDEISKSLNVSLGTITTDLKKLEAEGFIKRITPSASSRSHYFQIQGNTE